MVFLYLLVSGYYYFFPWNGAMFPTLSLHKRLKYLLILTKHIPSTHFSSLFAFEVSEEGKTQKEKGKKKDQFWFWEWRIKGRRSW